MRQEYRPANTVAAEASATAVVVVLLVKEAKRMRVTGE
jgi:hypothetical protein